MYPILCQIGPLTIFSYGVILALAVMVCAFLLQREACRRGISGDFILDFVFWVIIAGVMGCRLFFILLNLPFFLKHPLEIVMIHHGGLAWQGGLIAGGLTAVWIIKKNGLKVFPILDLIAPYLALGQSIGRIGCFLNGCCYGRETAGGIYFPVHGAYLHPTQLYSTFGLLILFVFLRTVQVKDHRPGLIFVFYLMFASVLRFIIEFFRADHEPFLFQLSIFQIMTIIFFLLSAYAFLFIKSRK